jgi:hypothetical protein
MKETSGILDRVPKRWKNHAAVMVCVGFAGVFSLTGCGLRGYVGSESPGGEGVGVPYAITEVQQDELVYRIHHGGSGSAVYVAHLTEQEAFGIIRAQLEEAGLRFGAAPPAFTVPPDESAPRMGEGFVWLDLFDEDKNVAVARLGWEQSHQPFSWGGQMFAEYIRQEFDKQTSDITFGVFLNPGAFMWPAWDWSGEQVLDVAPPTADEVAAKRPELEANIAAQVEEFVLILREAGILCS